MEPGPQVRGMPLKIAGIIGLVSAFIYLAGLIGQDDTTFLPQAIFWFAVMVAAGLLAWFAAGGKGRVMAVAAAALFFILGLFSGSWFAVAVYLAAFILSVIGIFGAYSPKQKTHIES